MNNHSARYVTSGFLAGAFVGMAAGALFTPRSGRAMRRKIRRKIEQGKDTLIEAGEESLEHGRELYDRGREVLSQQA